MSESELNLSGTPPPYATALLPPPEFCEDFDAMHFVVNSYAEGIVA
jgi:hypothetical protein